jgi:hypothetical protein
MSRCLVTIFAIIYLQSCYKYILRDAHFPVKEFEVKSNFGYVSPKKYNLSKYYCGGRPVIYIRVDYFGFKSFGCEDEKEFIKMKVKTPISPKLNTELLFSKEQIHTLPVKEKK